MKLLLSVITNKTYWIEDIEIIKETNKAYLIKFCNQQKWYPKSKIYSIDKKRNRIKVDDFWLLKFT